MGAIAKHTDWCAQRHRCGLGEHRSEPHVVKLPPGYGSLMVTRVRDSNGHEFAEYRGRLPLAEGEPYARRQLLALLQELTRVVWRARNGRTSPC